jgi:flagella basal body P-ring formation protein FlgA
MKRLVLAAVAVASATLAAPAAWAELLPVPAVTIYPGDVVADAMLTDREYPAGTAGRYPIAAHHADVVGKVARRTLLAGRAIPNNSVAEPDLVTRGTATRAVFVEGALSIETVVMPLQNGALGALVQARNTDTGKVVVGAVQADGTLRIGTP